jgi:hypothetical protein
MAKQKSHKVDEKLSKKCMDIAVNSGSYDPLAEKPETIWINQRGKVQTEKDPYGI